MIAFYSVACYTNIKSHLFLERFRNEKIHTNDKRMSHYYYEYLNNTKICSEIDICIFRVFLKRIIVNTTFLRNHLQSGGNHFHNSPLIDVLLMLLVFWKRSKSAENGTCLGGN